MPTDRDMAVEAVIRRLEEEARDHDKAEARHEAAAGSHHYAHDEKAMRHSEALAAQCRQKAADIRSIVAQLVEEREKVANLTLSYELTKAREAEMASAGIAAEAASSAFEAREEMTRKVALKALQGCLDCWPHDGSSHGQELAYSAALFAIRLLQDQPSTGEEKS